MSLNEAIAVSIFEYDEVREKELMRKAEFEEGEKTRALMDIKNFMESTGWPVEQVLRAVKIPEAEWPEYICRLEAGRNNI